MKRPGTATCRSYAKTLCILLIIPLTELGPPFFHRVLRVSMATPLGTVPLDTVPLGLYTQVQ